MHSHTHHLFIYTISLIRAPFTHMRTIYSHSHHSFTCAPFILHAHHSFTYTPFIYIRTVHSRKHHSFISARFIHIQVAIMKIAQHTLLHIRTLHLFTHHSFIYAPCIHIQVAIKKIARAFEHAGKTHTYLHTHTHTHFYQLHTLTHISTNSSLCTITLLASKTIFEIMVHMWMNGAFVNEWCVYELTVRIWAHR